MAKGKGLSGIEEVMTNLNKAIKEIEGASMKGVIKAGIVVIRDMEKTSPKIPVDTGNLRSSRFMVTASSQIPVPGSGGGFKGKQGSRMSQEHSKLVMQSQNELKGNRNPVLILGFSANYAMWVHERVDARFYRPDAPKGKKGRPGSGAKFLEMSLRRNQAKILEIIAKEARIK